MSGCKLGKADGENALEGNQTFLRQSDQESRLPRTVSWVPPPKTNDDWGSDENPWGQHLGPVPRGMVWNRNLLRKTGTRPQ